MKIKRDAKSEKNENKLFNSKPGASKTLVELDDDTLRQVAGGTYQCGGIGIPG